LISSACGVGVRSAMRDVVGDLVAGDRQHAVWRIAPCANTAMSVVPAPMSTSADAELASRPRSAPRALEASELEDQVVDLQPAAVDALARCSAPPTARR
jgi:hypothetical protein